MIPMLRMNTKIICPRTIELFNPSTFESLGIVLKGEIGTISDFGYRKIDENNKFFMIKVDFKLGSYVFTKEEDIDSLEVLDAEKVFNKIIEDIKQEKLDNV